MLSDRSEWVWMPHPGHLIVASNCRFHLTTHVGKHLVSPVGEYLPDCDVREILATSRGVRLEGRGDSRLADYMKKMDYEDIGYERKYETMVFLAKKSEHGCCPWRQASGAELELCGYNDPGDAFHGHITMCVKWAKEAKHAQST